MTDTLETDDEKESKYLHVWRTADSLSNTMKHHPLTPKVASILRQWGYQWQEQSELMGLLNKKNLLHEVEESVVALGFLLEWMDQRVNGNDVPISLVDVCCGKGICSMLASYLFQNDPRVSKVVMLDKANDLDWSHIDVANQHAVRENRPKIETYQCNLFEMDDMIEWLGSTSDETPIAFIGIHLCKNLSPTLVGIVNALGSTKAPFLCLAPCCLPRVVLQEGRNQLLEVAQYESTMQRQARLVAAQRRRKAQQRRSPCIICQSTNHRVHQCPLYPSSEEDQVEILQLAAALEPCWKCGEVGHLKRDCPSDQSSCLPALIPRPVTNRDVSRIIQSDNPFASYCDLLSTTIERETVQRFETGLKNTESIRREHGNNWNRDRKSIYIVATTEMNDS
jgi:hypothetical protein